MSNHNSLRDLPRSMDPSATQHRAVAIEPTRDSATHGMRPLQHVPKAESDESPFMEYGSGTSTQVGGRTSVKRKRAESPDGRETKLPSLTSRALDLSRPKKPITITEKSSLVRIKKKDVFGSLYRAGVFTPLLTLDRAPGGRPSINLKIEDRQGREYYNNTWHMGQRDDEWSVTKFAVFRHIDRPDAYRKLSDKDVIGDVPANKQDCLICITFTSWKRVKGTFYRGLNDQLQSQTGSFKGSLEALRWPKKPFEVTIWFYNKKGDWDRLNQEIFSHYSGVAATRDGRSHPEISSQPSGSENDRKPIDRDIKQEVVQPVEDKIKIKAEENEGGIELSDLYQKEEAESQKGKGDEEDELERQMP